MKWSLRRRIEEFLKRTRTSATRLGLDVTGDPRLVFQIRKGRAPRPPMEAKILAYMDRVERGAGSAARTDPARSPPLTDAATVLLQALRIVFGAFDGFVLEEIRSRRWASVTFQGARHELDFRLEGEGAEEAAGRFLSGLDARNFDLRGHLLADVSLVAEERRPGFARIRLDALTVEER